MSNPGKKSGAFLSFERSFFQEDDLSKPLFHMINMWTIDGLSEEEKIIAEGMLIGALEKGFDRRWIWGLADLKTETAYEFLLERFTREKAVYSKVLIAYSLVMMNVDAPVFDFLQEVLNSDEPRDVRMKALGALYWPYDKKFESKERHQKYLTILFEAMKNKTKDIRLYAYSIILDHYGIKEFTPLDDSVVRLISEEDNEEGYQEAERIFEDRVTSTEVLSIDREMIVRSIKELPDNPPTLKASECEICSGIPDDIEADMASGESLNNHTSRLDTVIIFAYYKNSVKRCPICGRLYRYQYHYEFLIGWQSEEDERLFRTDTKGAIELVDSFLESYDFKRVIKCGMFLKISY